jgi:glycosyltransferase involved in cell wall biosynthesis
MHLNLLSPINSLSYGYVSYNIIKSLIGQGHEISLFPLGGIDTSDITNPNDIRMLQDAINSSNSDKFSFDNPSIRIFHQNQLAQHVSKKLRIGFPIFELDEFTPIERTHLSGQDALFVCSKWAKSIIEKNGIKTPTYVVPLGVNGNIFSRNEKNRKPDNEPYRFLNIGKWEYRKGHDFLIEAFNNAFSEKDNVELILCPHNFFINEAQVKEWHELYKASPLKNKIFFVERLERQADIAYLINSCDCGIFPSRAEGWNLGLLECMAMGLDTIATNYSAHTEFCNSSNCRLLQVNELEPAFDGVFFKNGIGNWAALDDDVMQQCVTEMRNSYQSRKVNDAGIKTGQNYTWNNTATTLINSIRSIYGQDLFISNPKNQQEPLQ